MPEFNKEKFDKEMETIEHNIQQCVDRASGCSDFDAKCDWLLFAGDLIHRYRGARLASLSFELNNVSE